MRVTLMLCCGLLACSGASPGANQAAAAGITAGLAVAAAAINRAATDECWGSCSHGFGCDRVRGICVPIDELEGPEAEGQSEEQDGCVEEDDGSIVCPDDPPADASADGDMQPIYQETDPDGEPMPDDPHGEPDTPLDAEP
jgi:hypothetical protein